MTMVVRRIRPGEGEALRRIRLFALRDAPSAFASSWAAEDALPAEHWDEIAATRSIGDDRATFVAEAGATRDLVGMVGAYQSVNEPGTVELVAMFTSPAARGLGVGAALVDAVVTWAADTGANRIGLWVVRTNDPARRLYERSGFAAASKPAPTAPGERSVCDDELRMARVL